MSRIQKRAIDRYEAADRLRGDRAYLDGMRTLGRRDPETLALFLCAVGVCATTSASSDVRSITPDMSSSKDLWEEARRRTDEHQGFGGRAGASRAVGNASLKRKRERKREGTKRERERERVRVCVW